MKKRLLAGILGIVGCLHAAIGGGAQWEVRTTGNNNNGGFFDATGSSPGTDYSQQDAAQYTFSDLASTNGSTNPCVVTSASHNFVAADNRNGLHISAGTNWSAGWYEIVSTSANAATLDRACGSVASLSGGTYFVGGGQADFTNIPAQVVQNNTVNIKAGTYTITSVMSFGQGINNSANVLQFTGYSTSHGDNGTKPLITTATNTTDIFHLNNSGIISFDNIALSNTATTRDGGIVGCNANCSGGGVTKLIVRNSIFDGFTQAINCAVFSGCSSVIVENTEIKNSTGTYAFGSNGFSHTFEFDSVWIHNNTGDAFQLTTNTNGLTVFTNSLITNNGGVGINLHPGNNADLVVVNTTIASNTSDGISYGSSGTAFLHVSNSIIYGNGGWGINLENNVAPLNLGYNNAFGSNTSGAIGNGNNGSGNIFTTGTGQITLTANPFTSSTNFALNSTTGGGAAVAGLGFPGAFPGGSTTGTINVGAVQSTGGGGGGSGTTTGHMNSISLASFQ